MSDFQIILLLCLFALVVTLAWVATSPDEPACPYCSEDVRRG